jgi:phage regulator Rha-like protein
MSKAIVITQALERAILTVRGHRVLLDDALATLYGVTTKVFNQAVKRNLHRFPADFRFQLTSEEAASLRSQSVTSKGRGGRRYLPFAFTQDGVAMLSSVLNSRRAVEVNIEIMRAFVRLRHILTTSPDLARKLDALEAKLTNRLDENAKQHADHEKHFRIVFNAIRQLMGGGDDEKPNKIGFDIK